MINQEKLAKLRLETHERVKDKARSRLSRIVVFGLIGVLFVAAVVAVTLSTTNSDAVSGRAGQVDSVSNPEAAPVPAVAPVRTIAAGGYVEARRTALVWPGREGVVARVHVARGQEVRKGDLLLELDARAATAALDLARAELEEARARLQRVREGSRAEELAAARAEAKEAEVLLAEARAELNRLQRQAESGLVAAMEVERADYRMKAAAARVESLRAKERLLLEGSRASDIAAAEANVARTEAAVRQAELNLELTRLRAPFDGRILAIELEPGEVVSLFEVRSGVEIADLSELWVRVDVPEGRIGGLRLGDPAEVLAEAVGPRELAGRVVEIAPRADRQSNTIQVAVSIVSPPPLLRPDMSARVNITISGGGE